MTWEQSIVQKEHPALHERAVDIPLEQITGSEIQAMIADMHRLLQEQHDGVALAAPQIGASVRLFIVSSRVFTKLHPLEPLVYINPVITKRSKNQKTMDEGCLSVRGWYGKTIRSTDVTVTAYNERGHKFTRPATGLLAHIFQHEIDHLEGVLFCDHATDMEEVEIPESAR